MDVHGKSTGRPGTNLTSELALSPRDPQAGSPSTLCPQPSTPPHWNPHFSDLCAVCFSVSDTEGELGNNVEKQVRFML